MPATEGLRTVAAAIWPPRIHWRGARRPVALTGGAALTSGAAMADSDVGARRQHSTRCPEAKLRGSEKFHSCRDRGIASVLCIGFECGLYLARCQHLFGPSVLAAELLQMWGEIRWTPIAPRTVGLMAVC